MELYCLSKNGQRISVVPKYLKIAKVFSMKFPREIIPIPKGCQKIML